MLARGRRARYVAGCLLTKLSLSAAPAVHQPLMLSGWWTAFHQSMARTTIADRLLQALFESDGEEEPLASVGRAESSVVVAGVTSRTLEGEAGKDGEQSERLGAASLPTPHPRPPIEKMTTSKSSNLDQMRHAVAVRSLGPAEAELQRRDQYWWLDLVHNGLRCRISECDGIIWKMPTRHADPFRHCMNFLGRIKGVAYYIGITESPPLRWESHSHKYDLMYLVWVAQSSRETADLEKQLLDRVAFRSLSCENRSYGGERPSAGSPHFVYVCTRESGLMRGNYGVPRRGGKWSASVEESLYGPDVHRR